MKRRRICVGISVLTLFFLAIGYLTAWLSLATCAEASFREARSKGVSGRDMLGNKVVPTREAVTASIAGPFLVQTQYDLPSDLHGTIHIRRYVALPWSTVAYASEVIRLVDATLAPADASRRVAQASSDVQHGILSLREIKRKAAT